MENTRPNILYMHSHDTGRWIQPYGYPIPTPNLQRLADEGITFQQAYSAAPTCSPSRAALLTGYSPHANGMLGLAHRGFSLHHPERHILHTLKREGYRSALVGIQHVARDYEAVGYDEILWAFSAESIAENAAAYIMEERDAPFFLSVGFFETHRDFPEIGAEAAAYHGPLPAGLPDTPAVRMDMARFAQSLKQLDDGVGAVLEALEEYGKAGDTLVICTSDHGIPFPGMKCTLKDSGIGVYLMMRGPGGFEGGRVVDGLVSQLDIYPTVCELLGIEPPGWLEGVSLMPLVREEVDDNRLMLFAGVTYHAAYEPQRAIRTKRYKYIRRFSDLTAPVLPNIDDSPSKDAWMEAGGHLGPVPEEALYDLAHDPDEEENLAGVRAHATVLKFLHRQLLFWMERTGDPLLDGAVPAPPGAEFNDPDGLSPDEPTINIE
ncbi:MAG: sulfatase [Anaerolineales bacterium]|jgi:arylsulfatase A-like enzyme